MDRTKLLVINDYDFAYSLGHFHIAWAGADGLIDFAIGQCLRLSAEETHILTSGRDFGRKVRLLEALLKRGNHKQKSALIGNLRIISKSKRNILAHSAILSSDKTVTFLLRDTSGDYKATPHVFTNAAFIKLVRELLDAASAFQAALAVSDDKLDEFWKAALRANRKPTRSPGDPNS
jgi:hypothetical protein